MYILLLTALFAAGGLLAWRGLSTGRRGLLYAGAGIGLATVLFFALLSFWGEMLWFEALGYQARFWRMVATQVGMALSGVLLAGGIGWGLTRSLPANSYPVAWVTRIALALFGAGSGLAGWDELLLFLFGPGVGVAEPILGLDAGFYLFALPLLDHLYNILFVVTGASLAAAVVSVFYARAPQPRLWRPVLRNGLAFALVLAGGRLLDLFHLLYSEWGVVVGPGWTDVHVRLPALVIVAFLTVTLVALPLFPAVRSRLGRSGEKWSTPPYAAGAAWTGVVAVWLLGLQAAPLLVQWLVVEPNEISFERPYIANNIAFTRLGFRLHWVEERRLPAQQPFTQAVAEGNRDVLSEVRLWDWRAIDAVFRQFQEIRLYYEFHNVDLDRYTLGDEYRQVMISIREMNQNNLPPQSQTFINRRFKYTHGYGVVMAPVSEFTPGGLPRLLIEDIPPEAQHPSLAIDRPQIYYGELTAGPAVVNSKEAEFDYPSGGQNVYTRYEGDGGVPFKNLWRKFVFGWMFDGTPLLLSSYPKSDSRMMFHRQIRDRVSNLAPFLQFDADPYAAIVDGQIKWIIDAYTTSGYFPYSAPFSALEFIEYRNGAGAQRLGGRVAGYLQGANYVRNAVKAVVDAYDGSVHFYVFDQGDPIIQAWQGAFPGLFRSRSEMPQALRAHVRYPEGFLLVQGLVHAKYHMQDPEVFYNQEDLWVRATEKYYGQVQPVEPYYIMWKQPGSEELEYVLILPFTPKNRQVLIGWIAGMCDGEDYGRFLAYQFPKEERVLGPQQVETKIDQDAQLSAQLSLWDQRGSRVIRGNVLAIPMDQSLLYVEPIYLQAETAAYPELRLVVLMHGDTLSYADNFSDALQGLLRGGARELPIPGAPEGNLGELAARARQAFEAYLQLQGQGEFEQAGEQLRELQRILQAMTGGAVEGSPTTN